MTKKIGQTVNTNDQAIISGEIAINGTTSTKIIDAIIPPTLPHSFIYIYNGGNKDVWIKLQAAAVDDLPQGIFIKKQNSMVLMVAPNIYTGEISALGSGGNTILFITRF